MTRQSLEGRREAPPQLFSLLAQKCRCGHARELEKTALSSVAVHHQCQIFVLQKSLEQDGAALACQVEKQRHQQFRASYFSLIVIVIGHRRNLRRPVV
jgi:hypothetical protein